MGIRSSAADVWSQRAVRERRISSGVVTVERPFSDVAVHVVKAPRVWLLASNLLVFVIAAALEPCVFPELLILVAEGIAIGRSGATRIFPLRLGREPVVMAGESAEPLTVFVGRVLGHVDGGI